MSNDFWSRKLAGIAQPAPQAPAPASQQGAWWQDTPAQPQYPQQYQGYNGNPPIPQGYNPALQAQMPYGGPTGAQGMPLEQYIGQLKRIPTEDLNQQQMEEIARFELEHDRKYNQTCPQCGSGDFVPAGTVIQGKRMGSDKCFACGASASTFTSSPEPAVGGSKASKAPYRDVRQIDTGGAGGHSMYLKFNGVPQSYVPRGG